MDSTLPSFDPSAWLAALAGPYDPLTPEQRNPYMLGASAQQGSVAPGDPASAPSPAAAQYRTAPASPVVIPFRPPNTFSRPVPRPGSQPAPTLTDGTSTAAQQLALSQAMQQWKLGRIANSLNASYQPPDLGAQAAPAPSAPTPQPAAPKFSPVVPQKNGDASQAGASGGNWSNPFPIIPLDPALQGMPQWYIDQSVQDNVTRLLGGDLFSRLTPQLSGEYEELQPLIAWAYQQVGGAIVEEINSITTHILNGIDNVGGGINNFVNPPSDSNNGFSIAPGDANYADPTPGWL